MAVAIETVDTTESAPGTSVGPSGGGRTSSAWSAIAIVVAAAGAVIAGSAVPGAGNTLTRVVALAVVGWAAAAIAVALLRASEPLGPLMSAGVILAAIAVHVRWFASGSSDVDAVRRWSTALTAAAAFHVLMALPTGRLTARWRSVVVAVGYVASIVLATTTHGARPTGAVTVIAVAMAGGLVVVSFVARCSSAGAVERARLQWAGWGAVVTGLVALLAFVLRQLLDWPHDAGAVAVLATALVPLALALGANDRLAVRIDRLLLHTIVIAGLVVLIAAVYLVVVLGLGDITDDAARRLLALSMVAAIVAAILALPARRRLDEIAYRRVYGDQRSPDEALETFGSRMSRAVPMDELLLQLAETLKASMRLTAAEVWSGTDGALERVVSVPDRGAARITLAGEELTVVSRARVSGNAWLAVWMPTLLAGRTDRLVRVAPVAHSGDLLGLLVIERAGDDIPFAEEEERVLTELARQVGLALHNVRLDSALQASLVELELRNEQLQASRLRIVTAADESRRSIERNLHDGAQQHLVALAVKVGIIRQLLEADPATADTLLDELRSDVQATLTELRDLAHGIYPPLLRERGLGEALRTAANRSPLPANVDVSGVGRYSSEVEAAVYFCCLEAMQNAAKYAGPDASITVEASSTPDELTVVISDDGLGFDVGTVIASHGFINMADRIGAVGGRFDVVSIPGPGADSGTRISCRIPAAERVEAT